MRGYGLVPLPSSFCRRPSMGLLVMPRQAAVDEVGRAGDVIRVRGGEKRRQARDVLGLPQAAEGDLTQQRLPLGAVLEEILVDGRLDGTRRDGVDRDAEPAQLDGQ